MQNSEAVLGIPGNDVPLRYALNGKSADDVTLEVDAGEEIYLLFARGTSPSLGYHAERSSAKITL
eukprot:scaffold224_cov108-Skeletonema_marinoi.AAC.5